MKHHPSSSGRLRPGLLRPGLLRSGLLLSGLLLAACGGAPAEHAAPTSQPESQMHPHQHGHHHHHHHRGFDDPAEWAGKWDTAERDAWQKPDAVLAIIAPQADDLIADIGAGTGYFAMRLAQKAPQGTVYAVDLQPEMVEYLGQRAAKMGLDNVEPVEATADDARIPQPVDLVMLTNTYHHIGDRTAYFARIGEALKPGGRVAIVDYKLDFEGKGPPPAMRLSPDAVEAEMKAAGYRVALRDEETLSRQYILIFERGAPAGE